MHGLIQFSPDTRPADSEPLARITSSASFPKNFLGSALGVLLKIRIHLAP